MRKIAAIVLAAAAFLAPLRLGAVEGAGLTEEQTRLRKEALKLKEDALRPLLERQREGLAAMRMLIAADKSEREVKKEVAELKETFARIAAVSDRYETSLASFLTPSQRAKLAVEEAAAAKKTSEADEVSGDEEERE